MGVFLFPRFSSPGMLKQPGHSNLVLKERNTYLLRILAGCAVAVTVVAFVLQLVSAYQVDSMLHSPLIPQSTAAEILRPVLFRALVLSLVLIMAIMFFLVRRYGMVILAGLATAIISWVL